MICSEARPNLAALLTGAEEGADLRRHASACPRCGRALDQLRLLERRLAALPRVLPLQVAPGRSSTRAVRVAAALAAALAVAATAAVLLRSVDTVTPAQEFERRIDALVRELGAERVEDRVRARESLIALGVDAVPDLRRRLESAPPELRGELRLVLDALALERARIDLRAQRHDFTQFNPPEPADAVTLRGVREWSISVGRAPGVAAAGDRLFVPAMPHLYAIDVAERKTAWFVSTGLSRAPPVVWRDRVLLSVSAPQASGETMCLTQDHGVSVWKHPLRASPFMPLLVIGDHVLVGAHGDESVPTALELIRLDDGHVAWRSEEVAHGFNVRPVLFGDALLAVSHSGILFCLDAVTGVTRWRRKVESMPEAVLLLSGDTLVVKARRLYALDARTGEERWKVDVGVSNYGAAACAKDRVVTAIARDEAGPQRLGCFGIANGARVWEVDLPGPCQTALLINGDTVIVHAGTRLAARSLKSGDELWGLELGETTVVGSSLTLYRGTLYGIFQIHGGADLCAIR